MTAPPLQRSTPHPGGSSYTGSAQQQRTAAIAAAHRMLESCGITLSPSRVQRLVQQYDAAARTGRLRWNLYEFLVAKVCMAAEQQQRARNHPDYQRVIDYADPTGEAAVANVMRQRGR